MLRSGTYGVDHKRKWLDWTSAFIVCALFSLFLFSILHTQMRYPIYFVAWDSRQRWVKKCTYKEGQMSLFSQFVKKSPRTRKHRMKLTTQICEFRATKPSSLLAPILYRQSISQVCDWILTLFIGTWISSFVVFHILDLGVPLYSAYLKHLQLFLLQTFF